MPFHPELIFCSGALLAAGIGCYFDLRFRRIPNWLTGPAAIMGLGLHLLFGGTAGLAFAALAGLVAAAVMFLFFIAGGMGAGDVKLMFAAGCFTGLQALPWLLVSTALGGAVFALLIAFQRGALRQTFRNTLNLIEHHRVEGVVPHPELNLQTLGSLRMPFALPIAAACLTLVYTQVRLGQP